MTDHHLPGMTGLDLLEKDKLMRWIEHLLRTRGERPAPGDNPPIENRKHHKTE